MKKLQIIKAFTEAEVEYVEGTTIEVAEDFAAELIEKGLAQEIVEEQIECGEAEQKLQEEGEETHIEDEIEAESKAIEELEAEIKKIGEVDEVVKELEEKVKQVESEQKDKGNKIMNIEVKEQAIAPEVKLSNAVKLAKAIATGNWTAEAKAIEGQGETVAGDGGALVDVDIVSGIYANAVASSQIFAKVGKRPVGAGYNSFKIRQLNEANGTPADYNGVTLNVIAEGGAITPQKLAYTSDTVEINKLAAVIPFTSEILEDVPGIVEFTSAQVGTAFGMKLDQEILYGTDSLMTAAVGHAGSRAVTLADASAPTAGEIRDMYMSQINPNAAEWYMSGQVYENLMAIESTNGQQLIQPNYNVSPFGTLLGRPVNVVNCMVGANGVAGTISFSDFTNGYLVGTKGGVKMAKSVELYWLTDQEAVRWILRVGGAPTRARTMTLADGRIVAPIVNGFDS